MSQKPSGCHLVGSVHLPDTETVFRECIARLPGRLKRIPDGETGNRSYFTAFQFAAFSSLPQCMVSFALNKAAAAQDIPQAEVEENTARLCNLHIDTGYDDAAISSYAIFKRLKVEGVVPKPTRFQVCLPTGANVVIALHQQYREAGFEVWEAGLFRAMRKIQDEIPAEELSIQIDLAVDTAFWEGVYEKPWFDDAKEGSLQYILRMIEQVDEGVELGVHNCYGDMEHKHWMEPASLRAVTDRALPLLARSSHPISYFHCPVPLSAMPRLAAYLAPLEDLYPALRNHGCELYLGLVHAEDLKGTKLRIAEAQKVAPEFGVATECGLGRMPAEQFEDLMAISAEVSEVV